jgi:DNA-binding winged helix-turn-helix (wHTH) protein
LHEGTLKVRESMQTTTTRYRLDDLEIDTGARCVMRAGVDLGITGLSFELLLALGRSAPNLVSADTLMDTVWPRQVAGIETLAQRVKLLRRQLGDEADQPRYIASRRGHGYRLLSAMIALPATAERYDQAGEAFALYQQARAIVRGTHASRDEALRFLDAALAQDRELAPALAHRALLVAGSVPLSGEPRARLADAEEDARRALRRDPELVDAHAALGMIDADRHRWHEAAAHFRAALAREPANTFLINLHALSLLRPTGRLRDALAAHELSYRLAPADGFTLHELVLTHSLLGNDAEALRFVELGRTLSGIAQPPWDVRIALARVAVRAGRHAEAAELTAGALPAPLKREGGPAVLSALHAALGGESSPAAALQAFDSFAPRLAADGVDRRTRACFISLVAMLGAVDAAHELLQRLLFGTGGVQASVELSDLWLPEMSAFRADSRFTALLGRLRIDNVT